MICDIIVCCMLAVASATGVWTMQRHQDYFSNFDVGDLWAGRMDAWLYVLNSLSTAWCVADIALRAGWIYDVGWGDSGGGNKWALLWLSQHALSAVVATLIHLVTNVLLTRDGYCRLCCQPWDPTAPIKKRTLDE